MTPLCVAVSADIEREFKEDLEEAPYIVSLKTYLPFTFRFPHSASKVLDHLYLGAEEDATSLSTIRRLGITHVINCAAIYISTGPSFYGNSVKYLQFEAEDDEDYNMIQHFGKAYDFIEDARRSGGKVLLHCIMGVNRSGLLAVAYVMVHNNVGPITAATYVKKQRGMLLTNEGFQRQLICFARERGNLHLDEDKLNKGDHKL